MLHYTEVDLLQVNVLLFMIHVLLQIKIFIFIFFRDEDNMSIWKKKTTQK